MIASCVLITLALGAAVYFFRRSFVANLALVLLSLSLCFTVLETYFRFFYVKSDGFGRLSRNFAARYYQLDSYGLRDSQLPLSRTQPNVVVLGDSFVFGSGLKSPSERFSERLAAHYPQYHLVNLGWPGWDTTRELSEVKRLLGNADGEVSLVILAYFFNDIGEDVTAEDRARLGITVTGKESAIDRSLQRMSEYSRFVEFVYYRVGYPRLVRSLLTDFEMYYADPLITERHYRSLEALRSFLEERFKARLLVVVLPFLNTDKMLNNTALYRKFESGLEERGFDYVDMQSRFALHGVEKLWVSRNDPHTNGFANKLITDAIIERLDRRPPEPTR